MKETQEVHPILCGYDEDRHRLAFKLIGKFATEVNRFADEFNGFAQEIGWEEKFGPEILQSIFNSGRKFIELKIEALVKTKDKPLAKYYLESYYKELNKLDKSMDGIRLGIKGHEVPNELKQISKLPWKDNAFIVDEEYFKSIKLYFESWARSEQEHEVWTRYKAIETAYNEYYKYCNQEGLRTADGFNGLFGSSFGKRPSVTADPKFIFPLVTTEEYNNYGKI